MVQFKSIQKNLSRKLKLNQRNIAVFHSDTSFVKTSSLVDYHMGGKLEQNETWKL